MGDTSIQWTGKTINPIKARRKSDGKKGWACVRVSPGCERCYSETQNKQCGNNSGRHGTGLAYTVPALEQVELYLDEDVLLEPLRWREPTNVFPCSMTDWMADFVPDEWRDKMLAVMALTPQHTYQTLTKRADRQLKYLSDEELAYRIGAQAGNMLDGEWIWKEGKKFRKNIERLISLAHGFNEDDETQADHDLLPLKNLWVGVSVEDQSRADERIPLLLQTPAAIRWVSAEPLLSEINLITVPVHDAPPNAPADYYSCALYGSPRLDWGVIGLESGNKARPGNIEWIRYLLTQFKAAGVPAFVKQLGAKPYLHREKSLHVEKPGMKLHMQSLEIETRFTLEDKKGGDPSEWPEDLRVREYPEVRR